MTTSSNFPDWHGTTILAVRKGGKTVIAGDGLLGVGMADDVAVELGDDLAGGKLGHGPLDSHDAGSATGRI